MDDTLIKSEITTRWDNNAKTYDSFISHGVKTGDEKNLWMQAFLTVIPRTEKPLQVLDVGCGTGAMGLIFAEMGHQVTGIDLSENMMEQGRRKASERGLTMEFLSGDAENPPFPEDHFDVVVNRHLLWTLPHPKEALSAWKRVIKPGGQVLVIDGVWDDGTWITGFRRIVSQVAGEIFDPKSNEKIDYSVQVQNELPHIGGVGENLAKGYFLEAGFDGIKIENLIHIRNNQHKRLPWYQKIRSTGTYYLISGTKSR